MTTSVLFSRTHLEQALTVDQLRPTMIIRIGLMLGISFFYFVIFLVYSTNSSAIFRQSDKLLMDVMSIVHIVFTIMMTAVAFFISRLQLRPERLVGNRPDEVALHAIGLHRVSSLLLMVPIEGAAFFGAAICMIGVQNGILNIMPIYWLNAGSAVLLILVGLFTFPTREKVLDTLDSTFLRK
jgi:hypothetical protein